MDDLLVEQVLRCVELVPAGHVVSYGDVAAVVGTGPRQVGAVMAAWGHEVAWWRVTTATGGLRPDLLARALPHWVNEGITLRSHGRGCRIERHRPDLGALAAAWAEAAADLPPRGNA